MLYDNQSTIVLTHNQILHARTKHMELDLFFSREKELQKQLYVTHLSGFAKCVNIMTKALSPAKFEEFKVKLNVWFGHHTSMWILQIWKRLQMLFNFEIWRKGHHTFSMGMMEVTSYLGIFYGQEWEYLFPIQSFPKMWLESLKQASH